MPFNNGNFGLTDYTSLMSLVPRRQNLLQALGIFPSQDDAKMLDNEIFQMEREEKGLTTMHSVERGAERVFAGTEAAQIEMLRVPFTPLDSITKPQEVMSFREYGTENSTATIDTLVERKVDHIQRSHERYMRDAMYTALIDNKVHAKDAAGNDRSSLAKNFSTLWNDGGTDANRATAAINLGTQTVDPFDTLEAARNNVINKAGDDGDGYRIVCLVNSANFRRFVGHSLVRAAYSQYSSAEEPLRRDLIDAGLGNNRVFEHRGIVLVEDVSGKIPNNRAFVLPTNVPDVFMTAFAPADTIEHAGQVSEGSYLFMREDARAHKIESEVAFIAAITRPELITDVTLS